MAGHGAGCGPGPPPSSPDSSKHPFTCGDVPAVLGDGRAAASNEQCRGWDPTPWAAPITAPSPKTCSGPEDPLVHTQVSALLPRLQDPAPGTLQSNTPPAQEGSSLALPCPPSPRLGRRVWALTPRRGKERKRTSGSHEARGAPPSPPGSESHSSPPATPGAPTSSLSLLPGNPQGPMEEGDPVSSADPQGITAALGPQQQLRGEPQPAESGVEPSRPAALTAGPSPARDRNSSLVSAEGKSSLRHTPTRRGGAQSARQAQGRERGPRTGRCVSGAVEPQQLALGCYDPEQGPFPRPRSEDRPRTGSPQQHPACVGTARPPALDRHEETRNPGKRSVGNHTADESLRTPGAVPASPSFCERSPPPYT
ncbi:nascent polypeptide-associated complex subunit alpha, muscle-specific form-like [Cervus elaphus]|uniref:nascent polypeptide-associated complex subunit alpha, muscle-specific form-like n=1 Tax=Cervus elaphus TaxID=9860 RepID=UPI001CC2D8D0|nr:nascent polypeptide-associated complex subunit alpha, muscle-specific form-like [Cervus elaphus]